MLYVFKSSDTTNNIINLQKTLSGKFTLHSFTFNNEIYNVRGDNNNLPYFEGGSITNLSLTQQYVNGDDLAYDVQEKINEISDGTASVSYDSNTGKFTITNTISFSLKFGDNTENSCRKLLGFNGSNSSEGTSVVSDNVANITPYQRLLIKISEDEKTSVSDQDYGDYSFVITTKSDFGDVSKYISKESDIREQEIRFNKVKRFKVSFYNENGVLLTLNNWCLVLFQ